MAQIQTQIQTLPKYIQISEMLIRDVMAGRLVDGERLAPERDMAQDLGISVGTLRKSLADMESKGVLERRHGSGNYIKAKLDVAAVYSFFRVELLSGGGLPTAEVLSVDQLAKPRAAPKFGMAEHGYRIRRLRRLNGIPAVLEEIWLDGAVTDRLTKEDLGESLYMYYRNALNLWITKAEDSVGLGQVPEWVPSSFGQDAQSACVCVERTSYGQDGQSAEYSLNWVNSAVARYVARIR